MFLFNIPEPWVNGNEEPKCEKKCKYRQGYTWFKGQGKAPGKIWHELIKMEHGSVDPSSEAEGK